MRTVTNILLIIFNSSFLLISSCQDSYLDRPPKDRIDAEYFFNTANDLEVYTNSFYNIFPDFGINGAHDDDTDNIVPLTVNERVRGTRIVPVPRGSGGWSWSSLRSINFFLENYHKCENEQAKQKYGGIARFFRAYFYFEKIKRFGDVPWYNKVLDADDPDLFKPRDSRILVMDSVVSDINYAINNIPPEISLNEVTKHSALFLKARICLYEGTFRKYHNIDGYEKFLNEAVIASEQMINEKTYSIFTTGGTEVAYRELFARNNQTTTETILARGYDKDLARHNLGYLMTAPTMGGFGIVKDFINSYLMSDGSRFTDIEGYETMGFFEEMQNRDPRLTQTTAGPNFVVYGETNREPIDLRLTTTGYRVIKSLPSRDHWLNGSSYHDQILFRFAEALLIYAEAKAELGIISQADLDKSINILRDRVGMPHLILSDANSSPDPFLEEMYPNVEKGVNKGVILEIRRERRIELFFEGHRWDDLMRWKEGKKLEKPMLGIYFPRLGAFDFNNDGIADVYLHNGNASGAPAGTPNIIDVRQRPLTNENSGYFNPFREQVTFNESKDYFYPLPLEDLNLNENLEQNPGWKN